LQKNKFLKINFLESIFSYISPKHGFPLYHLKIFFLLVLNFLISYKIFSSTGQSVNSWVWVASATPTGNGYGACIVYAEKDGNPKIYNIRGVSTGFGIYDINTNVWVSTTALHYAASAGAAMTWDGGNFIYMLLGGTTFYQFDISAATFTRLADPPGSVTGGGAIVYVSTQVGLNWCYAFQGGTNVLWRYNINTNEWESLTGPGAATKSGSAMVWTGDEYIYCLVADASPVLRRYNINTNTWTNLANTPTTIGAGASIIWDGVITSSNIYALRGGAQISFWKYSISLNQWVWVSSVPATVGTNAGNKLARYGDYIYCRRGVTDDSFWRYRWRDVDPPGKITSFVAETGTNGGEINLSWVCPGNDNYTGNLPEGSTFYIQYSSMTEDVVFSTSSPQNVSDIQISTGPVIQGSYCYYTVGGLAEGVTYYFRIWAKDNAGNWSEISDGATAYAQITPLANAPSYLSATVVSSVTILLSWSLSDAATCWVEHSSVSSPYNWIWRSSVPAPVNSYTDIDLVPGVTYWYRLIAVNAVGVPNYSMPSNITSTITYTAAPSGFTKIAVTPISITWTWSPVGFADEFRIYQASSPTTLVATSLTTSYTETGLSTNTAYGRFVRAYNILGESLDSNHTTFYTLAVAPVNLQITEVYSSSVTLVWENGGNPVWTRYGVARAEDENFTVNPTTVVTFTDNLIQLTTTVTGLSGDTTYYFRVWAYNGDGVESYYSEVISTKTLLGIPAKPIGFYGVALSTVSIKWEWIITKCATYYQIYNTDGTLLKNLEGNGNTTYVETELSPNTQYSRYVKAGNEYGIS